MKQKGKVILASASPRRRDLLEDLGIEFDVVPSHFDESSIEAPVTELASRISEAKAQAVLQSLSPPRQDLWILAADTVVVLDETVYGKPVDREDASKTLSKLSGAMHQVYTAFSIVSPGRDMLTRSVCTKVQFESISKAHLFDYLKGDEWKGKAGSYAIQGKAGVFVRFIHGSHSNVIGLPLSEVYQALIECGCIEEEVL